MKFREESQTSSAEVEIAKWVICGSSGNFKNQVIFLNVIFKFTKSQNVENKVQTPHASLAENQFPVYFDFFL